VFSVARRELAYSFAIAKCIPRKIKLCLITIQQMRDAIVTAQVKLPVSSVYKINELIMWFMVAKPVRLRPRNITMTMVMMNSTDADRVTPRVNTHDGNGLMNSE
jgi:hypothetical protein